MVSVQARGEPLTVGPEHTDGQGLVPGRRVRLGLLADGEGNVAQGLLLDPRGLGVLQGLLRVHQPLVLLGEVLAHLER